MAEFRRAEDVERLARVVIRGVEEHRPLLAAKIVYLFRDDIPTEAGKAVWGTARKITGRAAFLAQADDADPGTENDPFFVIEMSEPVWLGLSEEQQTALLDHELSHLSVDPESGKLTLRPHDLEEFTGVYARRGAWAPGVLAFARAVQLGPQVSLFDVLEGTG